MKYNLNKQPEGRSTVEQASACLIPVTEKDHLNKQPKGRSTGIIGFILFDRN